MAGRPFTAVAKVSSVVCGVSAGQRQWFRVRTLPALISVNYLCRFTQFVLAGAFPDPNRYPNIVSWPLRVFWVTASLNVFPSSFLLPKIRW